MDCVLTMPKMENITVKEEIIEESLVADIDNPQDTSMKDEVESEITTKDEPLEHVLIKSESNREDCDPVLRNVKIENEFEEFDEPDQIPVEDIDTILHEETNVKKELVGCNDQNESMESESGNDSATPAETHDGIDEKPFKCEVCEKGYLEEAIKNVHVCVHFGRGTVPCKVCGKQFKSKQLYLKHYGFHAKKENKVTSIFEKYHKNPGTKSTSGEDLSSTSYDNKKYQCRFCSEEFFNRSDFIGHESVHTGKKVHHCSICLKNFGSQTELSKHLRIHTGSKPFECPVCRKTFAQKGAMKVHHVAVHLKAKSFQCTQCPQTFSYSSNFRKHMRIHRGDTPFKCKVCPKSFVTKHLLTEHERHHTGEKPFSCPTCSKAFRLSYALTVHMACHSDDISFHCTTCSKGFARKSALVKHRITTHKEAKSFPCSVCSKHFKHEYNLRKHEKTHMEYFECAICQENFLKKESLIRHLQTHSKRNTKVIVRDLFVC